MSQRSEALADHVGLLKRELAWARTRITELEHERDRFRSDSFARQAMIDRLLPLMQDMTNASQELVAKIRLIMNGETT